MIPRLLHVIPFKIYQTYQMACFVVHEIKSVFHIKLRNLKK